MSTAYHAEKASYQREYDSGVEGKGDGGEREQLRTTPLLTVRVKDAVDNKPMPYGPPREITFPQYGVLGFHAGEHQSIGNREPILLNTNAPNSTFICGQQGSGKSYTMSCMLENCLLKNSTVGRASKPLAGVVFHYDVDGRGSVAEAASLCFRGVKVNVLVSRSNYATMAAKYRALQGADEGGLTVSPLLFEDHHFTVQRMMKLMAFSEEAGNVPLYMNSIINILRQMAVSGTNFTFRRLDQEVDAIGFAPAQLNMLNMRMSLLKSFSASEAKRSWDATSVSNRRTTAPVHGVNGSTGAFNLEPGTLTIVDLTDPFVDSSTVCQLFDICLSLMKPGGNSIVVALDEAHKYLNKTGSAADFTDSLLTTIREQLHNATSVIITTQEPTISERLLDLCSVSIVHHFKSPDWFTALKGHLGAASSLTVSGGEQNEMFKRIVELRTGESLVFAPEAYLCFKDGVPARLGAEVVEMKTRKRDGVDAGRSVLASGRPEEQVTNSSDETGSEESM